MDCNSEFEKYCSEVSFFLLLGQLSRRSTQREDHMNILKDHPQTKGRILGWGVRVMLTT
jgi:hypothetical protein